MYGTSSPFTPGHYRPGNVYNRIGVETEVFDASPHRLIAMLFDGLFSAMAQAEGALQQGQRELKARALSRAVRIVDEGLRAGLNMQAGGGLSEKLSELYAYSSLRLTQANLRDDAEAIREVRKLLEPVRQAWMAIAPPAGGAQTPLRQAVAA